MHSLLWLEGVDFAEHLDDSNHLSVIRGGSLALLAAADAALAYCTGKKAGSTLVFGGASLALLRLPCDEATAAVVAEELLAHLRKTGEDPHDVRVSRNAATMIPPFAHLRFVAGVAPDDGTAKGPRLAQARARQMQMDGSLPRPVPGISPIDCKFASHRVGDFKLDFTPSHARKYNVEAKAEPDGKHAVQVSRSAAARWHYGRTQRQRFYTTGVMGRALASLIPAQHSFTDNLQDMVDLAYSDRASEPLPAMLAARKLRQALPVSLTGKIAVFYADGNDFNDIRDALGGTPDARKTFSDGVRPVMEDAIAGLLGAVAAGAKAAKGTAAQAASVYHDADERTNETDVEKDQLRFETLLYGGDEICFVAPAWFGLQMADAFFAAVKGKQLDGHALTFKAGLVFAPVKMPIAASRNLAKALAESMKRGNSNRLGIQAFESVEPPANGLSDLREQLFGKMTGPVSPFIALDGDRFGATLAEIRALSGTGEGAIPRSQLFKALRQGQWQGDDSKQLLKARPLGDAECGAKVAKVLDDYCAAAGFGKTSSGYVGALRAPGTAALAAWLLTHVWDYVDPVERTGTVADTGAA